MTVESRIGLALQEAREAKGVDQAQAETCLRRKYEDTPHGAISRWERGECVPPSKYVIWLLFLYDADIYRFMDVCHLEEMYRLYS